MPQQISIYVPKGKVSERIDTFLTHSIENATRTKVQKAIENGDVLIDGKICKSSQKVVGGSIIEITLPRDPPPEISPENIPLNIVYEDENLLVINKPAPMVVHPAYGNHSGTLVNALLYKYSFFVSSEENIRPGIVHRLDKNTSGLLVVAKDNFTHSELAKQFSKHTIEREYNAIVWGVFPSKKKEGTIEANISRSKRDRKKMTVSKTGKIAITMYSVIEEFEYFSLIKLKLKTGRTHQIRTHLSHFGHPIFGDNEYGGREILIPNLTKKKRQEAENLLEKIHRQSLHAKVLGFLHPVKKEFMRFESELPSDFISILEALRSKKMLLIEK